MARRSSASLSVVATSTAITRRPKPPADLSPEAAKHWRTVCNSLPADYFTEGDLPLLHALVIATQQKAVCDARVAQDGPILEGKAHPALKLSAQLAGTLATLSGKLRLCRSTRTRPDSAKLRGAHTSARRPWETDEGDE